MARNLPPSSPLYVFLVSLFKKETWSILLPVWQTTVIVLVLALSQEAIHYNICVFSEFPDLILNRFATSKEALLE